MIDLKLALKHIKSKINPSPRVGDIWHNTVFNETYYVERVYFNTNNEYVNLRPFHPHEKILEHTSNHLIENEAWKKLSS